jgi:hypothetical protein
MTPCSPVKVKRRFGRIYTHFCSRRVNRARNQLCLLPASCSFLVWFNFRQWWWRRGAPPKHQVLSELYSVTTQNTILSVIIEVRTSNPICRTRSNYDATKADGFVLREIPAGCISVTLQECSPGKLDVFLCSILMKEVRLCSLRDNSFLFCVRQA